MPLSLGSLPEELLCKIVEHCGPKSIHAANLRLTCRDIQNKTRYQFARSHFREVVIDCHDDGLRGLLDIAEDDDFRPNVRRICLHPNSWIDFDDSYIHTDDDDYTDHLEVTIEAHEFDFHRFERLLSQYIRPFKNLEGFRLLQTDIHGQLDDDDVPIFRSLWTKLVRSVLAVVIKQKLRVKEFLIDNSSKFYGPTRELFQRIKIVQEDFERLEKLSLILRRGKYSDETFSKDLFGILKSTKVLTDLRIGFDGHSDLGYHLDAILSHPNIFPALATLKLSMIEVPEDSLIGFLDKCKGTLQRLHLRRIQISQLRADWKAVFYFMLEELTSLVECSFSRLERRRGEIVSFRIIHWQRPFIDENGWMAKSMNPAPRSTPSVDEHSLPKDDELSDGSCSDDDSSYGPILTDLDDDELDELGLHGMGALDLKGPELQNYFLFKESFDHEQFVKDVDLIKANKRLSLLDTDAEQEYFEDDEYDSKSEHSAADACEQMDVSKMRSTPKSSDAEEAEFLKSFEYVVRPENEFFIHLKNGDGENIKDWLERVHKGFQIVRTPDFREYY